MKLMFKLCVSILFLTFALTLTSCGQPPGSSDDGPYNKGYGINGRWPSSSIPLVIKVPADFDHFLPDIVKVQNEINTGVGRNVIYFYQSPDYSLQFNDLVLANANMSLNFQLFHQHSSWYSSNTNIVNTTNVLAMTCYGINSSNYFSRGIIIFNFYTYRPVDVWNGEYGYDFSTILRHEAGHLLGLGHIGAGEESDSVMNPTVSWTVDKPLSARDISRLKSLYNP